MPISTSPMRCWRRSPAETAARRTRTPVRFASAPTGRLAAMIVLGVDPGTASTGYGVVSVDGSSLRMLDHGVIVTGARSGASVRLAEIHRRIAGVIAQHAPDEAALEDLFVGANPRNVLSVGQ